MDLCGREGTDDPTLSSDVITTEHHIHTYTHKQTKQELLHALCMLDEAELIEFAEERPALLIVTPGGATASLRRPQKGERLSLAGPTPMK